MAIVIPTYLEMCECGEHGRFVSPGGIEGIELS